MKKIGKKSCYYFYGKQWETWNALCENFKWEIPEKMNAAFYVCDAHAEDKSKVAIFHEDSTGERGKITFWELKNITSRLANYLKRRNLNHLFIANTGGPYFTYRCLEAWSCFYASHCAIWAGWLEI